MRHLRQAGDRGSVIGFIVEGWATLPHGCSIEAALLDHVNVCLHMIDHDSWDLLGRRISHGGLRVPTARKVHRFEVGRLLFLDHGKCIISSRWSQLYEVPRSILKQHDLGVLRIEGTGEGLRWLLFSAAHHECLQFLHLSHGISGLGLGELRGCALDELVQ